MSNRAVRVSSVLWLTGLSGAGKSTIANRVYRELKRAGVSVELLDGDALRAIVPAGFTPHERDAHVRRTGFMASRLEFHGVTVVCALTSPFVASRLEVRQMCHRFIEVYVSTPLVECERRDPKGLYALARRGDIDEVVGIHRPYELSQQPEIVVDTTTQSIEQSVAWVLQEHTRLTEPLGAPPDCSTDERKPSGEHRRKYAHQGA